MTQSSFLTVARRAWLRARRPRPYSRPAEHDFLTAAAIDRARGALDHPWFDAPPGTLPGKAAHVALLIGAAGLVEDTDPSATFAPASILMSQPIVEACLRIPTWQCYERGRNRAGARRAFQNDLPPEIAWRRTKGSPDSFLVDVFEQNRTALRDLLFGGRLAQLGLIDVPAIAAVLDDERPTQGHHYPRILQLADVEAWTRSFPG